MSAAYSAQTAPVKLVGTEKGNRCNKSSSEEITYKNISGKNIKLRLCVKKSSNGKWNCISNGNLKPGKTLKHYSCSGIADHRYWWGEPGSRAIYPKHEEPSGRFWTSIAYCKSEKLNFYTEEPHPAHMKIIVSNGSKIGYAKKRMKNSEGKTVYTIDYQHLYSLICGAGNTKKGSWFDRMKGGIRQKVIENCIDKGGKKTDCKKTGKSVGIGVRG